MRRSTGPGRPLDAIIIPAARRAQHLEDFMDLAACYGTTLVVLASHDCDIDEAAELMMKTPRRGRVRTGRIRRLPRQR